MRRLFFPVFFSAMFFLLSLAPPCFSGQVVSTMRNVNAVMEARGFRLQPAPDYPVPTYPGDHAPAQAFELIRPRGEAVKIGRLYTSCTCVRLEVPKNSFARGERAVFILRNVLPTPVNGQMYAMYIQVTSPLRTTLRYDTFFQSAVYAPLPDAPLIIGDAAADSSEIEIIEPEVAKTQPEKEEEAVAEPAGPIAPDSDESAVPASPAGADAEKSGAEEDGAGETPGRETTELKVKEVGEVEEPEPSAAESDFEVVEDEDVEEYVAKFLEADGGDADDEGGPRADGESPDAGDVE